MTAKWELLNDVFFEGKTLSHAGYAGGDSGNKVSQFYVDSFGSPDVKHFKVTWDFSEFYHKVDAGTFDWPFPHGITLVPKEDRQITLNYFSGPEFKKLGKTVEQGGRTLTIVNRPVRFAPGGGTLIYWAAATDPDGRVYKVFWNIFNLHEPVEIEMTFDSANVGN